MFVPPLAATLLICSSWPYTTPPRAPAAPPRPRRRRSRFVLGAGREQPPHGNVVRPVGLGPPRLLRVVRGAADHHLRRYNSPDGGDRQGLFAPAHPARPHGPPPAHLG